MPGEMLMAVLFTLLIALASRFPLQISYRKKIALDTSLIFASLLIFPPPWGPAVAGFGTFLGFILHRCSLKDAALMANLAILRGFGVQGVYLGLGGTILPTFTSKTVAVPILGAGAMMFITDWLLKTTESELYRITNCRQLFAWSWGVTMKQKVALLAMGVNTAVLIHVQPWALILTVPLIIWIYLSLRSSLQHELEVWTWEAVQSLADLIDRRDPHTAGHSSRVADLAEKLAIELGLSWEEVETIRVAAQAHDLGKMEIDASILTKPGPLTDEEWALVRQHPTAGAEIISRFPEFARGADYVRYHHERWDGRGYPYGLRGDEIPFGAQIIAVADAFDVMTSDRPYRKALPLDTVLQELERGAGVQWNERVVAALMRVLNRDRLSEGEINGWEVALA